MSEKEESILKAKFSLKIRSDRERADYLQNKVNELMITHIDKEKVKEVIDKLRTGIKYARDHPINESTELAAQTQLDLIGIFEKELGLE